MDAPQEERMKKHIYLPLNRLMMVAIPDSRHHNPVPAELIAACLFVIALLLAF